MKRDAPSVTNAVIAFADKMKIYTKNGDAGKTALYAGTRVSKSSEIISALGELDELNASLGFARVLLRSHDAGVVASIQNDLFILGSVIAGSKSKVEIADRTVHIEKEIDIITSKLPSLGNFILPSGSESSVRIHLARAVCRRCERSLVALGKYSDLIPYLNRLSDYLFTLARYENKRRRIRDEKVILNRQ